MAYGDDEVSVRKGAPRELYRFVGTYKTYRYTSDTKVRRWQAPDEDQEYPYLPITLQRSEITAGTTNDDGLDMTIDLPVNTELALAYAFNTSPPDLFLTMWRFHSLDSVVPYWRGRITNLTIDEGIVTFTSPSELGRAMEQPFPNVFYQAPCNHILYDSRCKILYDDWSTTAEITAINDTLLTVTANDILSGKLANALVGGEFVLPTGERRMVVSQSEVTPAVLAGNPAAAPASPATVTIGVNFPFGQVNVGTEVTVAAGCDYAFKGDCAVKFANQINFGGFPFIPEDNIFSDTADPGQVLPDNTCLPKVFDGVYHRIVLISPDPCNPAWDGNITCTYPQIQPNGNGGKVLNGINIYTGGQAETFEIYENNNPTLNPKLQGQLLQRFVKTDFNNWTLELHFLLPAGAGSAFYCHIFPSARFCGSVGSGGGQFQLNYGTASIDPQSLGLQAAGGNTDATWNWQG